MSIQRLTGKRLVRTFAVLLSLLMVMSCFISTGFAANDPAAGQTIERPNQPDDAGISVVDGKIVVSWVTPGEHAGIISYKVYEKDGKLGDWSETVKIDPVTEKDWDEHEITVNGAVIDRTHTYTFVLESINDKGVSSEPVEVEFTTKLQDIALNQYIVDLDIGETDSSLDILADPEYTLDKEVIWSSDNEAVAVISADGKITAKKAGTATVTALSTVDKSISATCIVVVKTPTLLNMTFNGDPKTSMAFDWYTSPKITATKLQVVEAAKAPDGVFPSSGYTTYTGEGTVIKTYLTTDDRTDGDTAFVKAKGKLFTSHKVIAAGLKPGTRYAYRAGNGDADGWSKVGYFTTDSDKNAVDGFNFVVTSDTQGSEKYKFDLWRDTFRKVIDTVNPKFVALTGDMTDDGDIEKTMQWFLGIPKDEFANMPFMPVFGSHETNDETTPNNNFFYHYNVPRDVGIDYRTKYKDDDGAYTREYGAPYEEGTVYSFEYGDALFVAFNGQYEGGLVDDDPNGEIDWVSPQFTKQMDYMKNIIAKSDKKWKFVFTHKGPFSAGDNADGEWNRVMFTRKVLAPLLNELGVDILFEGHDHMYMRSHQLVSKDITGDSIEDSQHAGYRIDDTGMSEDKHSIIDPKGTLYVMSATAAKKYYEQNSNVNDDFAVIDVQPYKKMFVNVAVKGDSLKLTSYTAGSEKDISEATQIYDTYSITRTDVKPDCVVNAKASTSAGKTLITWEAPASNGNITEYRVYEKNGKLGTNWTAYVPAVKGQKSYSCTVDGTGSYDFVIRAAGERLNSDPVTVSVSGTFADIANYGWARKEIEELVGKGIIKGTSGTTFAPASNISRADFLVMLVRTLGLKAEVDSNFSDVKPEAYYYEMVGIAKKLGISEGTSDNLFRPQIPITRQDMMVLTARAMKVAGKLEYAKDISSLNSYQDKGKIAAYAAKAVASLVEQGIIKGSISGINPLANTTRAEAAVLMYRIYNS